MRLLFNTIMLEPNRWTADHALTYPLTQLLDPIRGAGFEELEIWQYHLSGLDRKGVAKVAEAISQSGLRASALGAYPLLHVSETEWEAAREQLERLIEYGTELGIEALKIFPGRVASADADADTWSVSVERLQWLARELAARGVLLTMETHGNTLCDTLGSARRLLEELGAEANTGLCFQPYADDDTEAAMAVFDALRERVLHLHLQNRRGADRVASLLEEGDWTDYRQFLPHVRESGFDGLSCLEFTAGITPPDGEAFDLRLVVDNAARDRAFALAAWGVVPGH
ncbi:sugar phosphate isomerase/epimerase family protein [Candidatus Latescibacterota bacterium]